MRSLCARRTQEPEALDASAVKEKLEALKEADGRTLPPFKPGETAALSQGLKRAAAREPGSGGVSRHASSERGVRTCLRIVTRPCQVRLIKQG